MIRSRLTSLFVLVFAVLSPLRAQLSITAPATVVVGQAYGASVPAQGAGSFAWTITGGTFTSGATSNQVTFVPGPLDDPRQLHTASVLADGTILFVGGTNDPNGDIDATGSIFTPASAAFTPTLGAPLSPRYAHTATLLPNGQVLLAGGNGGPFGILSASEVFDPPSGQFLTSGPLNIPRYQHTATLLPTGLALVVGGIDAWGNTQGSAELFTPAAQAFAMSSGTLVTPRTLHAASLLPNGQVLLSGGQDPNGNMLASGEIYDPPSDQFLPANGTMNSSRYGHTSTVLANGQVLLVGGYGQDFNNGLGSAELYDPPSGMFIPTVGSMSTPRVFHTATLLANGTVLITGGTDATNSNLGTGELFDPATGLFTLVPLPMFTPRTYHTSSSLPDGRVLLEGGADANWNPVATPEIYDPGLNVFEGTVGLACTAQMVGGGAAQGQLNMVALPDPVPVIIAPTWMTVGATYTATVLDPGYLTFAWSISNGTITSASNQSSLTFIAGSAGPLTLACTTTPTSGIAPVSQTGTLNATVLLPPVITSFTATPTTVVVGGSTMLTATFTGTWSWVDNGGVGSLTSGVPVSVSPTGTTTYTLYVWNQAGTVTQQVTVLYVPQQPVLTAPGRVAANEAGFPASVQDQPGCSYVWQISGGRILSGAGTAAVTFASGAGGTLALSCTVTNPGGSASATASVQVVAGGPATPVITAPATVLAGMGGYTASVPSQSGSTLLWTIAGGSFASDPTQSQVMFAAGTLGTPRYFHTATLLGNGQVLMAGGQINRLGDITTSADLSNPVQSSIQPTNGPLSYPRIWHTATLLANGEVLLAGGSDGDGNVWADADIYDVGSGTCTDSVNEPPYYGGLMSSGRMGHAASLLNDGTVLLSGGYDPNGNLLNSADIFTQDTYCFNPVRYAMANPRAYHTSTLLLDGRVLLAGGTPPWLGNSLMAELYDSSFGGFIPTAGLMSTSRSGHTATLLANGQVLLVGGQDAYNNTLATAEIFNPATGQFTVTPGSLAFPRTNHTATLLTNGTVLVAGGLDGNGNPLASGEIFNPAMGQFSPTNGSMLLARASHTATLFPGGLVLMAGGQGSPSTILASPEVYDPVAGAFGGTLLLSCTATGSGGTISSPGISRALVTGPNTPGPVTITPTSVVLAPGGQQVFTANQPVNWTSSGGTLVAINGSTTATFTAAGADGKNLGVGTYTVSAFFGSIYNPNIQATAFINVYTTGSPVINSFTATPASIHDGQSTTLSWNASNATTLTLSPGPGGTCSVDVTGQKSVVVNPVGYDMDYVLTASSPLGSVWAQVNVPVDLVPSASLTASVAQVQKGGSVVLTPSFRNGVGQINPGGLDVQNGVPITVQPQSTTAYTLTVTNPYGGTATSSTMVVSLEPGAFLSPIPLPSSPDLALAAPLGAGGVIVYGGMTLDSGGYGMLYPQTLASAASQFQEAPGLFLGDERVITLTTCFNGRILSSYCFDDHINIFGQSFGLQLINPVSGAAADLTIPSSVNNCRSNYSATLLADGRVLISGGEQNTPSPSIIVDITAPNGQQVQNTGTPGVVRAGHVAIRLLDGRILIAGGCSVDPKTGQVVYLTSAELYHPSSGTWSPAGNLLSNADAVNPVLLHNGKVIFNGMEIFDPITNAFALLPSPHPGFTGFDTGALLLQDGRILMGSNYPVFNGYIYTTILNDTYYNPTTGGCSSIANASGLPLPADLYFAQLPDGSVLFAGMDSLMWCLLPVYSQFGHFDPQSPLTIQPAVAETNIGLPLALRATGPDAQGVTWSASGGTVTPQGQFVSQSVGRSSVTATAPDGVSATVWVDVYPPVTAQILLPAGSTGAVVGAPCALQVLLQNTPNQGVTWNLLEGSAAGTLTQDGIYIAATPGTYHILATSVVDPSVTAVLAVTAVPLVVQITPLAAAANICGTVQFQATTNAGSVTWSVQQSGGGTIDQNGTYTAPHIIGTYTVAAVSNLVSSAVATALVTVTELPVIITPDPASVITGGTDLFLANQTVTWSVQEGNPGGTISAAGWYQAPSTSGTYHVVAVSTLDATQVVTVPVTVIFPTITVSPAAAHVSLGHTLQLSATMAGVANPSLIWSIQEGAAGGSITLGGLYTAPSACGVFHLKATCSWNPNYFGVATVTVDLLGVSPNPASVSMGSALVFTADVAVNWAVQEGASGGSITSTGLYQPPQTAGTFHVVATSQANASNQITVPVTVNAEAALTWTGDRIYGFGQLVSEDRLQYNSQVLTTYDQSDQVGSPDDVTDGNGNITFQSKNLPFGERYSQSLPGGRDNLPFIRFAGHEDGPGSPIYMQARMYLPAYGRFASPDPGYDQDLMNPQSYSLFGYVRNNPVTHFDNGGKSDVNVFKPRPGESGATFDYREHYGNGRPVYHPELSAGLNPPFPVNSAPSDLSSGLSAGVGGAFILSGVSNQRGKSGEQAITDQFGFGKNNDIFQINGRDRIPDFVVDTDPLTGVPKTIWESKNVQYQAYTTQLKDYLNLAQQTPGGSLTVFMPFDSIISSPLQKAFDNPNIPLFWAPMPSRSQPVVEAEPLELPEIEAP